LIKGTVFEMGRLKMLSFQQEISLMEFFADSEYVAKLIGYCTQPVCLLMKYYELGSLDSWSQKNQRNFSSLILKLKTAKEIAQGIRVLHEKQVSHCDLKPQNILVHEVDTKLRFLLTDFGISKILTEEYLASEAFAIRNVRGLTVSYAAPDVFMRFHRKILGSPLLEKAGDIYSFGIIIFFVLSQCEPWSLDL
jgi:serine/threonine protein kinase